MSNEDTPKAGVKNDSGKVKFHLIPIEPLWALAKLYTVGALKYTPWNWAKGMSWGRVYDAMRRHGGKWLNKQRFDLKDGQHHLIAVAWCAFTLYVYELFGIGTDDRPAYNIKKPSDVNMDPALRSLYEADETEPESITTLINTPEEKVAVKEQVPVVVGNGKPKVVKAVLKEFESDKDSGFDEEDEEDDDY